MMSFNVCVCVCVRDRAACLQSGGVAGAGRVTGHQHRGRAQRHQAPAERGGAEGHLHQACAA